MSSEDNEAGGDTCCCASCGVAEIDDIKLLPCDGCDLVKYCSDECKQNHKSEHEEACKKRAVELRDELLFKQPESTHDGDCPICSLPLPLDRSKSGIHSCCGKLICTGCVVANAKRTMELRIENTCEFCRGPTFITEEEHVKLLMKRIEANDPVAFRQVGREQNDKGDYQRAFDYYAKAAALGDTEAHYQLSIMFSKGQGVEKDEGKEVYHLEEAAIGGHPFARHNIGINEWSNENHDRAVKHWIIAANQGNDNSMKMLAKVFKTQEAFKKKLVSKEDLAAFQPKCELINKDVLADTLRAHKAAVDATKSKHRDFAAELNEKW